MEELLKFTNYQGLAPRTDLQTCLRGIRLAGPASRFPGSPSGPSKFGPSEQFGQTCTPLDIIIPPTFHRLLATFYSAVQKFCHSCQDRIHSTISNAPLLLP